MSRWHCYLKAFFDCKTIKDQLEFPYLHCIKLNDYEENCHTNNDPIMYELDVFSPGERADYQCR